MLSNPEIEQTLIGLALTDLSCAERFALLPKDTFTSPDHVLLYQIIKGLVDKRKTPDMMTVNNQVGGADGNLMALMLKCVGLGMSPAMYDQYETTALDLRRRRRLYATCLKVTQKAGEQSEDTDVLAAELQATLNDNAGRPESQDMHDALLDYVAELEKPADFISTGISGFDRMNGGFRPGQLIYLGARPGVGKTALGLYIATHVAEKSGPVLIASLEMTKTEIIERMFAARTGIDLGTLTSHRVNDEQWGTVWGQTSEMSKYPIRFLTSASAGTPQRIKREAAAMKRDKGLAMIMIDYIGLMRGDGKYNSRYEEVSDISRQLKLMAMDLNVPILSLTQFNRNAERGAARPSMADARDSGSLEQDANVFLVQYAPDEPKAGTDDYQFWAGCKERGTEFQMLICEKYRQGRTGKVPLEFNKPLMRFVTLRNE